MIFAYLRSNSIVKQRELTHCTFSTCLFFPSGMQITSCCSQNKLFEEDIFTRALQSKHFKKQGRSYPFPTSRSTNIHILTRRINNSSSLLFLRGHNIPVWNSEKISQNKVIWSSGLSRLIRSLNLYINSLELFFFFFLTWSKNLFPYQPNELLFLWREIIVILSLCLVSRREKSCRASIYKLPLWSLWQALYSWRQDLDSTSHSLHVSVFSQLVFLFLETGAIRCSENSHISQKHTPKAKYSLRRTIHWSFWRKTLTIQKGFIFGGSILQSLMQISQRNQAKTTKNKSSVLNFLS